MGPGTGTISLNSCWIRPAPQRRGTETRLGGGERGIRTLDTRLAYTHFPGVLLQPLGHLSGKDRTVFQYKAISLADTAGKALKIKPDSGAIQIRLRRD